MKQLKTTKTALNGEFASFTGDCVQVHNIGNANRVCQFCRAVSFEAELESICCGRGNLSLPEREEVPEVISKLYQNKTFLKHIVAYNNLIALASLGCQEPDDGVLGYRSTYKIQGKIYHRIGSLLPEHGKEPKFGQLYFFDTEYELENRTKCCRTSTKMLSAS